MYSHNIFGDSNWSRYERKFSSFWPLITCGDLDIWGADLDHVCDTLPSLEEQLCQYNTIQDKSWSLDRAKCPTFSTLTCDCDLELWATHLSITCNTVLCLHFYCRQQMSWCKSSDNDFNGLFFSLHSYLEKNTVFTLVTLQVNHEQIVIILIW